MAVVQGDAEQAPADGRRADPPALVGVDAGGDERQDPAGLVSTDRAP